MEQCGRLMLNYKPNINPSNNSDNRNNNSNSRQCGGGETGNVDWTNECVFECQLSPHTGTDGQRSIGSPIICDISRAPRR